MKDIVGDTWFETLTVYQNDIPIAELSGPPEGQAQMEMELQVCEGIPLKIFWNEGGAGFDLAQQVGLTVKNSFGQDIYTLPTPPYGGLPGTFIYDGTVICDAVQCLKPTELHTSNVTQNAVDLSWGGPATGNWEYYVVPMGDPAPTAGTPGVGTTTNPVTGVTLDAPSTNYEFYVRMVCEGGTFSDWSDPYSFGSAICAPEDMCPYTFEVIAIDPLPEIMNPLPGYYEHPSYENIVSGWSGGSMTVYQQDVIISRIGQDFHSGSSQLITLNLCPDVPFTIVWTDPGLPGLSNVYYARLKVYNTFGQIILDLPPTPYDGTANQLVYSGIADCSTLLCEPPTGLYAENATTTSVDLGWDGLPAGSWEYIVLPPGNPAPDATVPGIATSSNPALNVILDNSLTNYEFYVRTVCSDTPDGYSEWGGPFSFARELCESADKCLYTFETYMYMGVAGDILQVYQEGVPVADIALGNDPHAPVITEVLLCPDFHFEIKRKFLNFTGNLGISVTNPFGEQEYQHNYEQTPEEFGDTMYNGPVNCTPPDCLKPLNPQITNIKPTEVTLNWDEMGTATSWKLWVLPADAPAPVDGTGGITVNEKPFVYGDDPGEILSSATDYKFFVMAICGDDSNSSISGGFYPEIAIADKEYLFYTPVINDLCENAFAIPVNTGEECTEIVTGNTGYAHYSGAIGETTCDFPTNLPDVWYSFVAAVPSHIINFTTNGDNYLGVFEGNCDALNQIYCDSSWPEAVLSGLTPGQTYYVRITDFNSTASPFELCIESVVQGPVISVSEDTYTIPELIEEFLLNPGCGSISNITAVTGTNFGSNNGIGYFNKNGSDFPLEEGIILATGSINQAPGPWPGNTAPLDSKSWPGDAAIELIHPGPNSEPSYNASIIEFDFVPSNCRIAFDFVFASNIYGFWDCTTENGLAILLTGPLIDPQTVNLAVVPNTDVPVGTHTVKGPITEEFSCPGQNESYFGQLNYLDPLNSPTGYSGQTIAMEASATVIAGETYHIKIVIADQPSHIDCHNSAVFITGKECSDNVSLGINLTGDNAVCAGQQTLLNSNLDPDVYDFIWYKDGIEITGETAAMLTVTQNLPFGAGTYEVHAYPEGSDCSITGSIIVEFTDPIIASEPVNLSACDASGFSSFDLSQNTVVMVGENTQNYVVTYHVSEQDAINDENSIALTFTNTTPDLQTIYARIEDNSGCAIVKTFNLIIQDLTPQFNILGDTSICEGITGSLQVEALNFDLDTVNFEWSLNGDVLPDNSDLITITGPGFYEVTINNQGCSASETIDVTELQLDIIIEEFCETEVFMLKAIDQEGSANPDTSTYSWTGPDSFTADGEQVAIPKAGLYNVIITTIEGCTDTAEIIIDDTSCFIQRGISPNDDDMNDSFDLSNLNVKRLSIYNRFGQEVYSRDNYTNEWRGEDNNGNKLPDGTYFYAIERNNGEQITGWIYISSEN